jgi:hypothetical protein
MKKKIVYTAFCLALVMCMNVLHAQQRVQMKIGYNIGMPVGSFKSFMDKNSFRGYYGEVSYLLNDQWKIGLGVQNNDYYEKFPRAIYETKDGTISAVVSNSIQTTPLLIKGSYELTKQSLVRPYVGLGAGFNLITYSHYLGEFAENKSAFKPAVAAEAGVNIPFNKNSRASGINAGAHYNYLPFKYNGLNNLNNWGLHLGLFFPLG